VKRIRRLLYPKGPSGAWTPLFSAVILVATAAVALAGWQAAPPQQQQTKRTAESRYDKWLNEDVVYIITAQERAAFKKLATDDERDHFIEQFWQQRDPTPGTAENEFKEEHYRRIAYSSRFSATSLSGWQTDRGRIYILYGPPDEIESHPSGESGSAPFEEWLYNHIEGVGDRIIFTFTDTQRNGEYHMTVNPLLAKNATGPAPQRIRVGNTVQGRNLITKVEPIYPPLAMQARIQGLVRFNVVIGKDGRVANMQLVSGHPLLVAAAQDAVRQWVYKPTLLNGEPVEVVTQVDVNFTLSQ
jgi:TonB family protein